jgi:hypothetical protein
MRVRMAECLSPATRDALRNVYGAAVMPGMPRRRTTRASAPEPPSGLVAAAVALTMAGVRLWEDDNAARFDVRAAGMTGRPAGDGAVLPAHVARRAA